MGVLLLRRGPVPWSEDYSCDALHDRIHLRHRVDHDTVFTEGVLYELTNVSTTTTSTWSRTSQILYISGGQQLLGLNSKRLPGPFN